MLRRSMPLVLLAAACGDSMPVLTPAAEALLARHADPSTWQDLDPAQPGRRLRDPRTDVVFVRVPSATPFLLAESELTAAQWRRYVAEFAGDATVPTPAGDALPMSASWHDAQAFCARFGYRLPQQEEWEFACRGGLDAAAGPWNDPIALQQHAWFNLNAGDDQHPVKTLAANPFGLYDMLGNVWEWCEESVQHDRVLRGGSWFTMPPPKPELNTRALPSERNPFYGFRPARNL